MALPCPCTPAFPVTALMSGTSDRQMREEASRPLAVAFRELLASAPEAQPFLRDWPRELIARPVEPRSLPVVAALRGLSRLAAPRTRALVEGVEAVANELDWRQTYGKADFGARFLETYGYNEWIGQRGAFISDALACGVLLLGPHTEYPDHSHEAEELYLPLAGRAFWRSGESDWRLRPPGTWIHHPSWTPHAMRTGAEPLLVAYVWRAGDLSAKSRIVR
jgi:dimethlysulfoniopropionate lyase